MKILVIDDHMLFLEGIQHILKKLSITTEVLLANDTSTAFDAIEKNPDIDLILFDLNMPGSNGHDFLKSMNDQRILIPAAVISATENPAGIANALNNGALGFIPKSLDSKNMLTAIQSILQGNIHVPESMVTDIESVRSNHSHARHISPRQMDVLRLMAKGSSNHDIAVGLEISESTVKSHVSTLFHVLDVKNRTECVKEAYRLELLFE